MALDPQRGRGGLFRGERRLSTETKHSSKSTELYVYIAVVVGILIASVLIGADDNAGRAEGAGDYFRADHAWALITWLTIGYMVARGLAKAGSREPYWEGGTNEERASERETGGSSLLGGGTGGGETTGARDR